MPTMNVSLTPELAAAVESRVSSGLYQSSSEVVRAALRRHFAEEREKTLALPRIPATLKELETDLEKRFDDLDRGEGVSGEESYRRVSARINARKAAAARSE